MIEEHRALVRHISSSGPRIQWLRNHVGMILEREAHQLDALGDDEGADHLRRRARAHVAGELPAW